MTNAALAVGDYGERLAIRKLVDAGMAVLDRGWRTPTGEVDIIARDGATLVICEVKSRRGPAFGTPAEAVTRRKVVRLRRLAAEWLDQTGVRPREVRFDVVEVYLPRRGAPRVVHLRGAF